MEGLGYWIFIAVLYLLSALMKKRQQQVPASQDSDSPKEKKSNLFQADFLQDMFGDMKEYVSEPEEVIIEELTDLDIAEKDIESEPISVPEEHGHVVFKDLSAKEPESILKESQFWKKGETKSLKFYTMLNNNNDLKRSIILKEILDKPRAIKKTIR